MPDEKKKSSVAFLKAAVAYYENLGIRIQRVMTDNGSCFRSMHFRQACQRLGLGHIRTKPYTPRTNGKAERFIQTALREWAYATCTLMDDLANLRRCYPNRRSSHKKYKIRLVVIPITKEYLTTVN